MKPFYLSLIKKLAVTTSITLIPHGLSSQRKCSAKRGYNALRRMPHERVETLTSSPRSFRSSMRARTHATFTTAPITAPETGSASVPPSATTPANCISTRASVHDAQKYFVNKMTPAAQFGIRNWRRECCPCLLGAPILAAPPSNYNPENQHHGSTSSPVRSQPIPVPRGKPSGLFTGLKSRGSGRVEPGNGVRIRSVII